MEILKDDALVEVWARMLNSRFRGAAYMQTVIIIAVLKTKEKAEELLKEIQDRSLAGSRQVKDQGVWFAEKVELKDEFIDASEIAVKEEIIDFIIKGTNEIRNHEV
jgi:hypothetical protein